MLKFAFTTGVWMDPKAAFRLRSGTLKGAVIPGGDPHPGEDLADWLQEAAKRPWVSGPLSVNPAILPAAGPTVDQEPRLRRHRRNGRELVALAVLTIAYLQFYYLDVIVQIGNLQRIVVFVPLTAA